MYKEELQFSDMQNRYNEGHSIIPCCLIYKEVISYYIDSEGILYSCLLDASKAFGRVHFGKLFELLLKNTISIFIIRLIFDSYLRQEIFIMCDGIKSEYCCFSNGVKQGCVISSMRLSLFIDPVNQVVFAIFAVFFLEFYHIPTILL